MVTKHRARAIAPEVVETLRVRDDAGRSPVPWDNARGGLPLRCCLRPSEPGERVLLASYAPLRRWAERAGADPGPYDECGPVFVHARECAGPGPTTGYPVALHGPRRVLRSYDARGRILGGRLVELPAERAAEVDGMLAEVLADPAVALVHVRSVGHGCFLVEIGRN